MVHEVPDDILDIQFEKQAEVDQQIHNHNLQQFLSQKILPVADSFSLFPQALVDQKLVRFPE